MKRVLLLSTYDLGHQPFALGSAAAWLAEAGCAVTCRDLAVGAATDEELAAADLIGLYLPMHTATRLALPLLARCRRAAPRARVVCFGLYAPLNAELLRRKGAQHILGGEFEAALTALAAEASGQETADQAPGDIPHQRLKTPRREGLPPLADYAQLDCGPGDLRTAGYTETTRGCKHLCRHCPIVPVYQGAFRVVPREVVLADIRQQVAAGARHITFGDPDFFNGPSHGLAIVRALHEAFPTLTYDVTIKVEHLLRHRKHLPALRETGCLTVTSAVEAFDALTLDRLNKGHTGAQAAEAVALCDAAGLTLVPTFVAFTPWTTRASYLDFLRTVLALGLVDRVAPVQYALRLLITARSPLLELPDVQAVTEPFDQAQLVHPWRHPDPAMDRLAERVMGIVQDGLNGGAPRREIFRQVAAAAAGSAGATPPGLDLAVLQGQERFVPRLTEDWYC